MIKRLVFLFLGYFVAPALALPTFTPTPNPVAIGQWQGNTSPGLLVGTTGGNLVKVGNPLHPSVCSIPGSEGNQWLFGAIGTALQGFNYYRLPASALPNNAGWTIQSLIKTNEDSNRFLPIIMDFGSGPSERYLYCYNVFGDGQLGFEYSDNLGAFNQLHGSINTADEVTHTVTATGNLSGIYLFVDGVLSVSGTVSVDFGKNTVPNYPGSFAIDTAVSAGHYAYQDNYQIFNCFNCGKPNKIGVCGTPNYTKTTTPTTTGTRTASPTRTVTRTVTKTVTPTPTYSCVCVKRTVSFTPSQTFTASPTPTRTPSPTRTSSPTLTATPTASPTATPTASPTATVTETPLPPTQGRYHFEQNGLDSSGLSHDLVENGTITYDVVPTPIPQGLFCISGMDDTNFWNGPAGLRAGMSGGPGFCIEGYVYYSNDSQSLWTVTAANGTASLELRNNDTLTFQAFGSTLPTATGIFSGAGWYFFACSVGPSGAAVYFSPAGSISNTPVSTNTSTVSPVGITSIVIGNLTPLASGRNCGPVDDWRFSRVERTSFPFVGP